MRGYDYHKNKLDEYRIHYNLKIITKDVRIAMKELNDDYDKFRLLIILSKIISPQHMMDHILLIICTNPDEIVFSDVVMTMLCLCHSSIIVYPYCVNIILSKFTNALRTVFWSEGYYPLANVCCSEAKLYELDMVKILVRHGIDIHSTEASKAYSNALEYKKIDIADYLLEQGVKLPLEFVHPMNQRHNLLVHKRRACRDAVMAVVGVFLRRCRFNKNVATNILKPMIWETRLDERWGLAKPPLCPFGATGEVSQHKKRKE